MTELQETIFAREILDHAQVMAFTANGLEDKQAATMAILVRSLILSTPQLSAERRAGLFTPEEE